MTVELIMQVSSGEDNRLSDTARRGNAAEARIFSGTLELMRVFEELVPADAGSGAAKSAGDSGGSPAAPESSGPDAARSHSWGEG